MEGPLSPSPYSLATAVLYGIFAVPAALARRRQASLGVATAPLALHEQGLDVIEHGPRVQERGAVDLADEPGGVDQEDLEHVGQLATGLAIRAIDRHADVLTETFDERLKLADRARGEEVPAG